ncbi:NAD(P)H-hydrate dehydratase [Patescibacteria group bacterium]|nr:NAD(P)H-hydrate dehydratase [Patescibacteria group bacterium]MCL5010031.1 NAD(P)H-hydrate dehydratase [Patescibacteria group bacterium]
MYPFSREELKKLYLPRKDSHKGQNGKLLVIGGSRLFHAASLWSLKIASRIVDMVFYSSIPENNAIVQRCKEEFRDGIIVPRDKIDSYIKEADCVLIGPGLPRLEGQEEGDDDTKKLTETLLKKYPGKKWIIDGGSLQVMDPRIIPRNAILTPHRKEFEILFENELRIKNQESGIRNKNHHSKFLIHDSVVLEIARKYKCVILLKGQNDIVCSSTEGCAGVNGGNAGMTKGGTGDVLSGLVAALYCKNGAFLSALAGSFFNKMAGDSLFKRVGYYFNASDLADEIPKIMASFL